jgi:hypothetical protein
MFKYIKYFEGGKLMLEKKFAALNKDMYEVKDGKVYITCEELANAIQDESLQLFIDEEAAAADKGICGINCLASELTR